MRREGGFETLGLDAERCGWMVKYHVISSHNESGASQTVRFGDSNALDAANSPHLSSILAKDN